MENVLETLKQLTFKHIIISLRQAYRHSTFNSRANQLQFFLKPKNATAESLCKLTFCPQISQKACV